MSTPTPSHVRDALNWVAQEARGVKMVGAVPMGSRLREALAALDAAYATPVFDDETTTFLVFAQGDRTAGDGDHEAKVSIPYMATTPDVVLLVRQALADAFRVIFDAKNVRVMTQAEYEREQRRDAESEAP